MKTPLTILLLTALTIQAQLPPPPSDAELRRSVRAGTNAVPARGLPGPGRTLNPPAPAATPAVTPTTVDLTAPPITADPGAAATADAAKAAAVAALKPPEEIFMGVGKLDFVSAPLDHVLTIYAEFVGRTIIRPTTLPAATIVLKNQTPLTRSETIQLLNSVLAINGIAMVNMGDKFVKAVPVTSAGGAGATVGTNAASEIPALGTYTTHVVQLKYWRPADMQPNLIPFASVATAVLPVESSGILILRDNAENVKRMLEMIERLDIPSVNEFISEVIPIKFARAEDIASALNSLSGGGGGGTTVGGTRSNARNTAASQRPGVPGSQLGGQGGGGYPNNPMGNTPGGAGGTGVPSSGASFSDRLRNIVQKASASGDLTLIGQTKIIADTRSNSLLIFATREDMKMIKDIIDKLDVVLPQVLIETIIMDVTLDDTWALGFSGLQTRKQFGDVQTAGGVNAKRFTDNLFSDGASSNAFTDLIGTGLRYFGKLDDEFFFQLEAAATDSRVNVIQKPRIQTSHATPASIFIGRTVPYVSGTYYGYGTSGGSSSYQQLRVGIGLNVTPYINADGLVLMQIDETIDEISGSTEIANVGAVPNTTSRTLAAEVAVKDRETIILGGFIRDSETSNSGGIPILKDIPILGYLFKSSGNSKERSELIVLMRPTVLRTPEMAAMHVDEEKKRLPGVRQAEEENLKNEQMYMERFEKSTNRNKNKRRTQPEFSDPPQAPSQWPQSPQSPQSSPDSSSLTPEELRLLAPNSAPRPSSFGTP